MTGSDGGRKSTIGGLTPQRWLLIGLLALAVVGLAILRDYGEGVDEWHNAFFGWTFVHAYESYGPTANPGIEYYNGPFFMMIWVVTSQALHWMVSSWMLVDARHFTTFVTFLIGLWLLFRLCLRFVSPRVALLTTALFASQPLLFGHAFLNQKDTPLMVFFLASLVCGWAATDRLTQAAEDQLKPVGLAGEWGDLGPRARLLFALGVLAAGLLLLDLWVTHVLLRTAEGIVRAAYDGRSLPLVNSLFQRVATDAYKTPVALYVGKLDRAAYWLGIAATAVLLTGVWWGSVKALPESAGRWLGSWRRRWGLLILTGILIGCTTSIRIVGPFAGALVCLVLVAKLGRRAALPSLALALIAVVTTYLTWPVLWGDPLGQFLNHISQTAGFTTQDVLYAGRHYESTNLPWHYLPWLLMIQLTLPAAVAILAGLLYGARRAYEAKTARLDLLVIVLWAAIPAAAIMLGWISIYNNFRHELFILPPLFVLAGLGLEWASHIALGRTVRVVLALLALAPGVIGIVRLHPYEYVYYNALVGGVDGATGAYELDYWCTSMREAMGYVDRTAPPGAEIGVAGAMTAASPFARGDLDLYLDRSGKTTPDMAVACHNQDTRALFPDLKTVYEGRRGTAVLAVVKGPAD